MTGHILGPGPTQSHTPSGEPEYTLTSGTGCSHVLRQTINIGLKVALGWEAESARSVELGEETYRNLMEVGAQGGAHAENDPEIDQKLATWVAEMEEIIAAWPKIEPMMRTGLMSIVRSRIRI